MSMNLCSLSGHRRFGMAYRSHQQSYKVQEECGEQMDAIGYSGCCGQWLVPRESTGSAQVAGAWVARG